MMTGHSNQTASDWQWLHNYGTLLHATEALAKRSCLPTSVFHIHDKDQSLVHSARHPLVCTLHCLVSGTCLGIYNKSYDCYERQKK